MILSRWWYVNPTKTNSNLQNKGWFGECLAISFAREKWIFESSMTCHLFHIDFSWVAKRWKRMDNHVFLGDLFIFFLLARGWAWWPISKPTFVMGVLRNAGRPCIPLRGTWSYSGQALHSSFCQVIQLHFWRDHYKSTCHAIFGLASSLGTVMI